MADNSSGKENDNSSGDTASYIQYDAKDIQYFGAQGVIEKELEYIRRRRGLPEQETSASDELKLTGLALSGGGIRSASFSLGVMQALAHNGWLKNFDYLSTVSGGGYIGASVSWLLSQEHDPDTTDSKRFGLDRQTFPYGTYPMSGSDPERRRKANTEDTQAAGLDRRIFPYGTYPISGSNPELHRKANTDDTQATSLDAAPGLDQIYKGKLLRYLRQGAKYLTPGDGINAMSLVAVILRGALVSLSVYAGLLLVLFLAVAYPLLSHTSAHLGLPLGPPLGLPKDADNLALWSGLLLAGLFVVSSLGYAMFTRVWSKSKSECGREDKKSIAYRWRQIYERGASILLIFTVALLVLGAVPVVYDALGAEQGWIGALSTLFGALSGVFAFFKTSSGKKGRIPMGLVVTVATAAIWFGLLLLAYHFATKLSECTTGQDIVALIGGTALAIAILSAFLGWTTNINYLSIHRYYRDRLMELFMPDIDKVLDGKIATRAAASADKMPIHELLAENDSKGIEANPAPYPLINTNVVLESSNIPKFRGRGGDNFILSPYFCGSNATGWRKSADFMDGRMTLPTAMAISGAAVNPSTGIGGQGVTRQPLLSMLMGLLNIRLGYWASNPNPNPRKKAGTRPSDKQKSRGVPNFLFPGLCEIFFRSRLNEAGAFVQLTDGGHFENLALYELIRRRTRLIVLCDGGADPDYQFSDFANAVEKVRVDFGTLILCDCEGLQALVPRRKTGADTADDAIPCAERGYIMCPIIYPDNSQGRLIYLKTSFFEQLSADLYGYKKTHPQFPDEPTSDQFFDEKQFEAYRELGFQTAWRMMQDASICDDAFVRPLRANN
ncbi:FIG00856979: hypothetical protein [hydrothermal vent metagenome]|uniref:PNPLA domain-containing protein n=1 Tax=hydrothermal vent metagenome TaxID=652676 RepID=A0A3B1B7I1_9ZZZZ